MEKKNKEVRSFILEGVEYVNQSAAAEMTGHSAPSFKRRAKLYGIQPAKVPSYTKVLYRKKDIEEAVEKGWFVKWYNV